MSRILVTGASGQLGHDLVTVCRRAGDDVTAVGRAELDITDRAQAEQVIGESRPDAIINCAAWTAVDACESDPDRAMSVNGDAVAGIAEIAERFDAHLVQISTDYVFDGDLDRPYREDDRPNPASVYGRSKWAGELAAGDRATVVRTSWVCGAAGQNMVATVLRLLESHPRLSFVDDQIGNPSFTADLAEPIRSLAIDRAPGIYHVTNATPGDAGVSWYEFVCDIVAAAGGDPAIVEPISTAELDPPRPAPRPANGVLATTKLARLRPYRLPLAELVTTLTER